MDFEDYVGGIEDAILALLKTQMPGVKSFETYSGQLDSPEELKTAIAAKARSYPLVMVSYADGMDVKMPGTAPVLGRAMHYRHDCTFVVLVVSTNARGEGERRRGATGTYQMMSIVRRELSGIRFSKFVTETVDNEEVQVKKVLTTQVLEPKGTEYIAKMPNITAYALPFETAFQWSSPDRSEAGEDVTEFVLTIEAQETTVLPPERPGVRSVAVVGQ